MASVWPEQYIAAGDTADPRDVMRNFNTFAREWNGYWDRENVPDNTATVARLAVQALMAVGSNPVNGTTSVAVNATAGWKTLANSVTTVTTTDGVLVATGCAHWDWNIPASLPTYNDRLQWRLVINGEARAHSGWFHVAREQASCRLVGSAPVAIGTASIALQYNVYSVIRTLIDDNNNGTNVATVQSSNRDYTTYALDIDRQNVLWEMRKV